MSSTIVVRGVSYEFANGHELFSNLNFSLDAKLSALVGPNGVGKTCLAKLLVGEFEPTKGEVRRNAPVKLFPQRMQPGPVMVAEFLSADYRWSHLGQQLLGDINAQSLCTTLSGGQWMRVRLARALDGDFLILDEPTNDLDREGREAVLRFLERRDGGALLISHDREVLALCEDILELSNRGLEKFGGGWSAYAEAKQAERERLSAALESAKSARDAARTTRILQQERQEKRNRRGAKAAARGGIPRIALGALKRRAESSSGKLDAATQAHVDDAVRAAHEAFREMKVDPVMYADLIGCEMPERKLIAEARGFNIRFNDWIYRSDLSFTWRGNVRVAIEGANGSGKSTLVKAVLGHEFETRGELRRGSLTALYLDQCCSVLDDSKNVIDNVRAVSSLSEIEIRNGLARFLFVNDTVFQKAADLSGGERVRATLARAFLSAAKPELLVLDEPTNNLDLMNVEFLERIVNEFRGALIVISHDRDFLKNCGVAQELLVRSGYAGDFA